MSIIFLLYFLYAKYFYSFLIIYKNINGLLYRIEDARAERAQLPKKMDALKLSMFNKVYHTVLSNPVKIKNSTSLAR